MACFITNGKIKIGAYKFADRKRPYIGVAEGSTIMCYGQFLNDDSAEDFMRKLAVFIGVEMDGEDGESDGTQS